MLAKKESVERSLTVNDRTRLFSALGIDLDGRTPTETGWINSLRRPLALGHDENPSFSVNVFTGAVKDFGSEYQNDLYGLVQDVRGCSFPEALDWISSSAGIETAGRAVARERGHKKKPEPVTIDAALDWNKRLLEGTDKAAVALRNFLCQRRGLDIKAIANRGLGIRWNQNRHRLFFPFKADDDFVTHYKTIAFDVSTGDWLRNAEGRKIIKTCGQVVLYMSEQATEFSTEPLVICEGEIDAILARQQGFNAVTGTGGAGTFKKDWVATIKGLLNADTDITFLYDGDEAGQKGAQKAATLLTQSGVSVRIGALPEEQDVSDVLRAESGQTLLQQIIDRASPFELKNQATILSSASTILVADERIKRFRSAADICRGVPLKPNYLAEPWLVTGALTELIGKIKWAGKTTWVLHLVKAILSGSEFLGKRCKRSPVVLLTEQPEMSFRQMLFDTGLNHADDLRVLYWHKVFGMPWRDVVESAVAECQRTGAQLLVIDTVFQFAGVADENSSTDADAAVRPLKLAAAKDLAVLCVRHERKGGGSAVDAGRGSSAFSGQMDLILHLKRPEGNAKPTLRTIEGIGRFAVPDSLVIELKEGTYVCRGNGADVAQQDAEEAIMEYLPTGRDHAMREKELRELMPVGIRRTVFNEMLKSLAEQGHIQREQLQERGKPYVYWLPVTTTL